jgi:hypothetical protein
MPVPINQAYPYGPPTVNAGGDITVATMLNEPTRVTQALNDITLQKFWANRVFAFPGGVEGGAVVYDQLTANDIYATRDVQNVEPGAEFPILSFDRPTPVVAQVEKYGGKWFVTDEARDRNRPTQLTQGVQKAANTINRKTHQKLIAVLEATITAFGGALTFASSNNWTAALSVIQANITPANMPVSDFAKAQLLADQTELGIDYDLLILNPVQASELRQIYGDNLSGVLSDNGISDLISSNRVTDGTGWLVAEGQVGETRIEKPLDTETWREQGTQRTWLQSDVRPVMYVTNPYAMVKITGI